MKTANPREVQLPLGDWVYQSAEDRMNYARICLNRLTPEQRKEVFEKVAPHLRTGTEVVR